MRPVSIANILLVLAVSMASGCQRAPVEEEIRRPPKSERASMELRLQVDEGAPGGEVFESEWGPHTLASEVVLTEKDVTRVALGRGEFNEPYFHLWFSEAASARLREFTRSHLGQGLAFVVDGEVLTVPIIQGEIGDDAMITGLRSEVEARKIAERLAP